MGIIMMESFQRFATGKFDDAGTGPIRPFQADPEWGEWAGGSSTADAQNISLGANSQAYGLYQDPIVASKKRFALDGENPAGNKAGSGLNVYLERLFSSPKTKYTIGVLVRFRQGGYFTSTPTGTLSMGHGFEIAAAGRRRATNTAVQPRYATVGGSVAAGQATVSADTFGVPGTIMSSLASVGQLIDTAPTLRLKGTADPNGSGIVLSKEQDHFFELEVDVTNQTLKVWVDDIYAGQVAWNSTYDAGYANGFQLRMYRGATVSLYNTGVEVGGVMISDIYCIDNSDGIAPDTRLGKTTRVMGELPDTDVSTGFTRPSEFDTNVDVINDPIADNVAPTYYLTGDGAGTEDLYENASSNVEAFAGTVYGVMLRARFQNASATTHELAIPVSDGTTETDLSLGNVAAGTGILMKSAVMNVDPSGQAWTPAVAASLKYGFKIVS